MEAAVRLLAAVAVQARSGGFLAGLCLAGEAVAGGASLAGMEEEMAAASAVLAVAALEGAAQAVAGDFLFQC